MSDFYPALVTELIWGVSGSRIQKRTIHEQFF
jgi:hypothetical protein